ncbi:MAG TPA: CoA transferase [Candidatus Binataceae bacterium]|nr:CoA transferase [Candidatus Binataceae bacterium]
MMLAGCRVLDLTTERGLLCGQILADLGADVIKIEPPGGSPVRAMPPFFKDEPGPERSIYWWSYNRNKRGVTLNLDTDEGRAILRRLAAKADFVLESDNPGDLGRRGLAYSDLREHNPAIVYVSITPFGQDGPKATYADSDLIIMAAGGTLILYGDEDRAPIRMSVPQAYLHACVDAAAAALIAYYARLDAGLGQHVDVAAQESVGLAAQSTPLAAPIRGAETRRMAGGAKMGPIRIPLVWQAKDGQVSCVFLFGTALGPFTVKLMDYIYAQGECDKASHDKDWIAFGDLLLTGKEPMSEYERMKGVVAAFMLKRTKAELFEIARENNLLIAPVATIDDVLQNPQFIAREYWQRVENQAADGSIRYPGPFARFGATPITFRRRPPAVGEHNREIFGGELGMSDRELAELARKRII